MKKRRERTQRDVRYESVYDVPYGDAGGYFDCRFGEAEKPKEPVNKAQKALMRNKEKYYR